MYTPAESPVPLDVFYSVPLSRALIVGVVIGLPYLLGYSSDASLAHAPFLLNLREKYALRGIMQTVFRGLVAIHTLEAGAAFVTVVRRKWYSPLNIIKWTISTFVFGVESWALLRKHGRQVRGINK